MAPEPAIDGEAFKKFEREGYSRVAEGYVRAIAMVTSQVYGAILDAVGAGPGTSLLDVACGPGWLSAAAVQRGAVVTALDLAEKMVALARLRCPQADVQNADAENLPFEPGRFDAVVCSFGILHLPDPERAIAEAHRVLRRDGRYAFTCWTPPDRNPFFGLIFGSIQKHGSMNVNLPPGPPLFRFGDPAECERALSAGGFRTVAVAELALMWPFAKPEDVVPAVVASTARIGPLLAMQAPEQRRNIESAIAEGARKYATARGVEIPLAALLAVGQKP
jgi:SAM-dependent methyltransferase